MLTKLIYRDEVYEYAKTVNRSDESLTFGSIVYINGVKYIVYDIYFEISSRWSDELVKFVILKRE